jgi:hypothetical protein
MTEGHTSGYDGGKMETAIQRNKPMNSLKTSSLLLIIGSITFLAASFSTNPQVYMEASPSTRLAIIQEARTIWNIVNFFYAAGALLSAFAAVGVIASLPRRSILFVLSALAFLGGALFFTLYVNFRVTNPDSWVRITPPHPLFLAYTLLTQAGLLIFGAGLLTATISPRLGWALVGGSLLLFSLTLIFRDMPPLAYYLLLLAAGVILFRRSKQEKSALPEAA